MQPPLINEKGDINIHGRDELSLLIDFDGEDVSNAVMFFEVGKIIRVPVETVPGNPTKRRILLLEEDVDDIPTDGLPYALRDETAHPYFTRLDGTIRTYGWTE